jgi:hypothetical protein
MIFSQYRFTDINSFKLKFQRPVQLTHIQMPGGYIIRQHRQVFILFFPFHRQRPVPPTPHTGYRLPEGLGYSLAFPGKTYSTENMRAVRSKAQICVV